MLRDQWGKNEGFRDHSAFFQGERDVTDVPFYYVGEEDGTDFEAVTKWKPLIEFKEGLSKPLTLVIERLNLLGHTYEQCAKEFAFLARLNDFDDTRFTFAALRDALEGVDVKSLSADYGEGGEDFGIFSGGSLLPGSALMRCCGITLWRSMRSLRQWRI
jgi:hypothetical protein